MARSDVRMAVLLAVLALSLASGCAARPDREPGVVVHEALVERSGHGLRPESVAGEPAGKSTSELRNGVRLDDGLDAEEAVALALWHDPSFGAELARLGIARADLVQSGLLANPVLSFLFPLGPKQLEAALRWPLDALFTRQRRIELAALELDAVAQRMVSVGLVLVRDVKVAFAEAVAADETTTLRERQLTQEQLLAEVATTRLRVGVASEQSHMAARDAAAAAEGALLRAQADARLARLRLSTAIGVELECPRVELVATMFAGGVAASVATDEALWIADAIAARPDARAAEIAVDAAVAREALAHRSIFFAGVTADVNGDGDMGAEIGPGVDIALPLFDRGEPRVARAQAELDAARRRHDAVHAQIASEVRTAALERSVARERLAREIAPRLELAQVEVARAHAAAAAGNLSPQAVAAAELALLARQIDEVRARAEARIAQARLEAAVGRRLEPGR